MSWGFRSLVTTQNDLKCATHFQGLCVCVFIWVRVIRISNVFWICRTWISLTWLVFVRMSIRLFAGEMGEKCRMGLNRSDGSSRWNEYDWLTMNGVIYLHISKAKKLIPSLQWSRACSKPRPNFWISELLEPGRIWAGGILSCQCNGLKNANFCWIILPYSFHFGLEMNINEPNHPPKATIHQGINFALSTLKGLRTTWPWGQGPKSMFFLTQNEGNGLKMLETSTAEPLLSPKAPSPKRRNLSAGTMDAIDSKSMQVHWAKMIGLFKSLFIQTLGVLNLDPTSMKFSQGLTSSKSSTIKICRPLQPNKTPRTSFWNPCRSLILPSVISHISLNQTDIRIRVPVPYLKELTR